MASTRNRDRDGKLRRVEATADTRKAAERELKQRMTERGELAGSTGPVTADTPFPKLVELWLETITRYAQEERWAVVIEAAPLPDEVLTSDYYPALETTLRRAESHGYQPERVLADAARILDAHQSAEGQEPAEPAILLVRIIERIAAEPRRCTNQPGPRRVAGLLPRPIRQMSADMRAALAERQQLIERAAQELALADLEVSAAWTKRLGTSGRDARAQAAWFRHATTIRLYRERYGITGPSPLGNPDQIKGPEQVYKYRAARAAYDRARFVANQ